MQTALRSVFRIAVTDIRGLTLDVSSSESEALPILMIMGRGVLIAFLLLVATSCGSPAERERGNAFAWTDASIDASDQTVRINFIGSPDGDIESDPCAAEYEAVVEETVTTLTVTIYPVVLADRSDEIFCDMMGYFHHIDLTQVLDGRTLIDGATGETKTPS